MSSEPESTESTQPVPAGDEPEVPPPPAPDEPPPSEDDTPPPPPPPDPDQPIVVEPATWYEVESACVTATCPNLNTTTTEPLVYSNAGTIRMVCGVCGKDRKVLSATKLDPQPEMS